MVVNRPQIGLSTGSQRDVEAERVREKQRSIERGQRLIELEKQFTREGMQFNSRLAVGATEQEIIRDLEAQLEQRKQQRVARPRFENVQSQGRAPIGRQIEAGLFGLSAGFGPLITLGGSIGEAVGESAAGLVVNPTETIQRAKEIADDRGGVHGLFDPLVFGAAAARETSPGPATAGAIGGGIVGASTAAPRLGRTLARQFKPPKEAGLVAESPVAEAITAKLTKVLKEAKPARKTQLEDIEEARALRAKRVQAINKDPNLSPAQKAIFTKSTLQGELSDKTFSIGREALTANDLVTLRQAIRTSRHLAPFDAHNLDESLMKILGGSDEYVRLTRDPDTGRFIKPRDVTTTKITGEGLLPTDLEIEKLAQFFGADFAAALRKHRSLGAKAYAEFLDVLNLPRTMLASFGIDALRQGAPMIAAHPRAAFNAFNAARKAAFNVDVARKMQLELYADPHVQKLVRVGKLQLTDFGENAGRGARTGRTVEEGFVSRWAQMFPWVRVSERANVTFFNQMRAEIGRGIMREWDEADAFAKAHGGTVRSAAKARQDTQSLGRVLNLALGRGELGPLERHAGLLSATFFSPRLIASRFQLPFAWLSRSPAVRKQIARDLAIFTGTNVGILAMLKAIGGDNVDVELDPRSSDFGQLKLGAQRIDFWGGFRQVANLSARLASGETKTLGTESEIPIEWKDALLGFFRFKLSPQASTIADFLTEETALGEDPTVDNQFWDRLFPLVLEDMTEAYKEQGLGGAAASSFSLVGLNTNTFLTTQDIVNPLLETKINIQAADGTGRITDITDDRLTPTQRSQIMARPDVQELLLLESTRAKEDALQVDRNFRRMRRIASDTALVLGEKDGASWRQDLLQNRLVAAAISETRELLTGGGPVSKPQNENEAALNRYFEIVEEHRVGAEDFDFSDFDPTQLGPQERQAVSNAFDVVGFGDAIEEYLGSLSSEQRAFVLDNIHADRTPVENMYYEAQEILEPYWDVPENLIKDPRTLDLYNQWRRFTAPNARAEFERRNPIVGIWHKRVELIRNRMRRRSRDIDDMLIAFYGGSPQHALNKRESVSSKRISETRTRIFQDADARLNERLGIQ